MSGVFALGFAVCMSEVRELLSVDLVEGKVWWDV